MMLTVHDVDKAMQTEVLIASAVRSNTKRAKDYKYRVDTGKHIVRVFDGKKEDSREFDSAANAVDAYNCFKV